MKIKDILFYIVLMFFIILSTFNYLKIQKQNRMISYMSNTIDSIEKSSTDTIQLYNNDYLFIQNKKGIEILKADFNKLKEQLWQIHPLD